MKDRNRRRLTFCKEKAKRPEMFNILSGANWDMKALQQLLSAARAAGHPLLPHPVPPGQEARKEVPLEAGENLGGK